jgi:hypothetical protein
VRWINNEMKLHKAEEKKTSKFSKNSILKMKSLAAKSLMQWEKSFGN